MEINSVRIVKNLSSLLNSLYSMETIESYDFQKKAIHNQGWKTTVL